MPDGEQITPKNNFFLLGLEEAEKALLGAYNSNKLHNSWLISGVKGIGKATLAYRFARFLLDERRRSFSPASSLATDPDPQTAWFLPVLIPISKSLNAILSKPTAKKC